MIYKTAQNGGVAVAHWDGSSYRMSLEGHEGDQKYGTPMEGTLTEIRGIRAGHHVGQV